MVDSLFDALNGRSLTGAWIETRKKFVFQGLAIVAPLRGRGLKHQLVKLLRLLFLSLPYGGVD